jgi:predicted GNAT family acetyltransferase
VSWSVWQAEGVLTASVRLLDDTSRPEVEQLLESEPIAAAQVADRVHTVGLTRRPDSRLLGYGSRGHLESVCWHGNSLIPVSASTTATQAFAEAAGDSPRLCSSLVGEADAVLDLWRRLEPTWGPARDVRPSQPLLATWAEPVVPPDPAVRLVRPHEVDLLFPAAVAMYTEEVGVSPLVGDGGRDYRRRVADLVRSRRAYAKFIGRRVVFKAELAVVTRHTAQVQGVWVAPEWRGRGLGTVAMAAVVRDALRRVAPSVSLYVNDYNVAARSVYARTGFRQLGTFATVLL